MVLHTSNRQRLPLILASDTPEVGPEPLLQFRLDKRASFLGRPHTMHQATGEGVHRIFFFRPAGTSFG